MTISPACGFLSVGRRRGAPENRRKGSEGKQMERKGIIAPKRAAPKDDPRRKLRRIAAAVAYGGMDTDAAAHRLAQVLAGARTDAERKGWARDFRATVKARRSPPDAVEQAARAVKWYAKRTGAAFAHLDAPHWVTTDAQRRLYLFALLLGFGGRTFGIAQNQTGVAFGINGNTVRQIVRKAKRYGFLAEIAPREVEPGRWRYMALYTLADRWARELERHEQLFMYSGQNLAWLYRPLDDLERERLAGDILTRAHAYTHA